MDEVPQLIEVHVLSLPVPIWERAREHGDGMMREFALIQLSGSDHHAVPRRATLAAQRKRHSADKSLQRK